jgi:hypothetical protein
MTIWERGLKKRFFCPEDKRRGDKSAFTGSRVGEGRKELWLSCLK